MHPDRTHEVGEIFNAERQDGTSVAVLEVLGRDEQNRATELKVLSRRPFAGTDGLAEIAFQNTSARSVGFQNGDSSIVNVMYGAHPYTKENL